MNLFEQMNIELILEDEDPKITEIKKHLLSLAYQAIELYNKSPKKQTREYSTKVREIYEYAIQNNFKKYFLGFKNLYDGLTGLYNGATNIDKVNDIYSQLFKSLPEENKPEEKKPEETKPKEEEKSKGSKEKSEEKKSEKTDEELVELKKKKVLCLRYSWAALEAYATSKAETEQERKAGEYNKISKEAISLVDTIVSENDKPGDWPNIKDGLTNISDNDNWKRTKKIVQGLAKKFGINFENNKRQIQDLGKKSHEGKDTLQTWVEIFKDPKELMNYKGNDIANQLLRFRKLFIEHKAKTVFDLLLEFEQNPDNDDIQRAAFLLADAENGIGHHGKILRAYKKEIGDDAWNKIWKPFYDKLDTDQKKDFDEYKAKKAGTGEAKPENDKKEDEKKPEEKKSENSGSKSEDDIRKQVEDEYKKKKPPTDDLKKLADEEEEDQQKTDNSYDKDSDDKDDEGLKPAKFKRSMKRYLEGSSFERRLNKTLWNATKGRPAYLSGNEFKDLVSYMNDPKAFIKKQAEQAESDANKNDSSTNDNKSDKSEEPKSNKSNMTDQTLGYDIN
jgi:hypothetical protein